MALTPLKIEHNGAKNGGGAWTTREDAKRSARKKRRQLDRQLSEGSYQPRDPRFPF